MKPRIHYLILWSCLLLVLPLTAQPSNGQTLRSITESDVQAMLNRLDQASRKGNVAGMLAPLAPDIKIKATVLNPKSNKEVVGTLNKEQYASGVRQLLRRRTAYQLDRKNVRIKIYDAQTATVMSDVYETLTFRQGTLRGSSSEVLYVGLRNGKLVITATDSRTRLY